MLTDDIPVVLRLVISTINEDVIIVESNPLGDIPKSKRIGFNVQLPQIKSVIFSTSRTISFICSVRLLPSNIISALASIGIETRYIWGFGEVEVTRASSSLSEDPWSQFRILGGQYNLDKKYGGINGKFCCKTEIQRTESL